MLEMWLEEPCTDFTFEPGLSGLGVRMNSEVCLWPCGEWPCFEFEGNQNAEVKLEPGPRRIADCPRKKEARKEDYVGVRRSLCLHLSREKASSEKEPKPIHLNSSSADASNEKSSVRRASGREGLNDRSEAREIARCCLTTSRYDISSGLESQKVS